MGRSSSGPWNRQCLCVRYGPRVLDYGEFLVGLIKASQLDSVKQLPAVWLHAKTPGLSSLISFGLPSRPRLPAVFLVSFFSRLCFPLGIHWLSDMSRDWGLITADTSFSWSFERLKYRSSTKVYSTSGVRTFSNIWYQIFSLGWNLLLHKKSIKQFYAVSKEYFAYYLE